MEWKNSGRKFVQQTDTADNHAGHQEDTQHTGNDEQRAGSQGDVGPVLAEGNHQYIGKREENNCR